MYVFDVLLQKDLLVFKHDPFGGVKLYLIIIVKKQSCNKKILAFKINSISVVKQICYYNFENKL